MYGVGLQRWKPLITLQCALGKDPEVCASLARFAAFHSLVCGIHEAILLQISGPRIPSCQAPSRS